MRFSKSSYVGHRRTVLTLKATIEPELEYRILTIHEPDTSIFLSYQQSITHFFVLISSP